MPHGIDLGRTFVSGLPLFSRGKVRDTYEMPGHPDLLFPVAGDRISIWDFVLNAEVLSKGEVLTAMNIFWKTSGVLSGVPNDLMAFGDGIVDFIGAVGEDASLQKRGVVVKKLNMLPVEWIIRGYLTGSGWSSYQETGKVCGHLLPPGLNDGSKLERPIVTPTTKAEVGHDEHLDLEGVLKKYGRKPADMALHCYEQAAEYAARRGIIVADTKLEIGVDDNGNPVLCDEAFTPDSSRFWSTEEWKKAQEEGKSPKPHDKQIVRNYGESIGIKERAPENKGDYLWVREQRIPERILRGTSDIYRDIFYRLADKSLKQFQKEDMGIS